MSTYEKVILSGSTNGRPIKIVATATAGTLIHTATAVASQIDELWLWVTNTDSASRLLTLEWGGVSDPDDHLVHLYPMDPNSEPVLIVAGLPLRSGLVARAFGSVASIFVVTGYVNRITQ